MNETVMEKPEVYAPMRSPRIAPLPATTPERLVDRGMLYHEASLAGRAERYGRGKTSHTIHVWWARRPHSAMRSLVFASLCKDASSQEALDILRDLANAPSKATNSVWSKARNLLTSQYRSAPKILDMFGGGGTIPMEASALGADAYACDANELSVFVQRCNAQYSQRFDTQKLVKTVRHSGSRVLNQLAEETAPLFPLRKYNLAGPDPSSVFGYLWSYSMECTE